MSDGDLLLEAVRAAPEDSTVRLIYADWCEEQGEQARAEFIRRQVHDGGSWHGADLLHRHRTRWDGAVLRKLNGGPLRGKVSSRRGPVHRWEYSRGFIESVTVRPSAFLAHGDDLLSIGPIQEVRLVREAVPWEKLAASPFIGQVPSIVVRMCDHPHFQPDQLAAFIHRALPRAEVVYRWNEQQAHGGKAVTRDRRWLGRAGKLKIAVLG